MAALNAVPATYTVNGIPPLRGVPRSEVTCGVDADLIFTVSARESATGRPLAVSQRAG